MEQSERLFPFIRIVAAKIGLTQGASGCFLKIGVLARLAGPAHWLAYAVGYLTLLEIHNHRTSTSHTLSLEFPFREDLVLDDLYNGLQ